MSRKRKKLYVNPVPVDLAMQDVTLISPDILQPGDDYGDPEAAMEMAVRNQEGRLRHGFRALLDELGD